jgi:hypothetical protein
MSDELKDILSGKEKDIEQDKLLEYLNRQLSEEEQHELESRLNDDEFASDAIDGLQDLNKNADLTKMVKDLNSSLKKQLDSKKKRRQKKSLKPDSFVYYTAVILLLLTVVAFVAIKMFMKN